MTTVYSIRDYYWSGQPNWIAQYIDPDLGQPNLPDNIYTNEEEPFIDIGPTAVGPDGSIYVFDNDNGLLRKFDPTLQTVENFVDTLFPSSAVDMQIVDNYLYLAHINYPNLRKYNLTTAELEQSWILPEMDMSYCIGVTYDHSTLYWTTGGWGGFINRYDLENEVELDPFAEGEEFFTLNGVRPLPDGRVLCSEYTRITLFDSDGSRIGFWYGGSFGNSGQQLRGFLHSLQVQIDGDYFWTAAQNTGVNWTVGETYSNANIIQRVPLDSYIGWDDGEMPPLDEEGFADDVFWFHAENDGNYVRHSFVSVFETYSLPGISFIKQFKTSGVNSLFAGSTEEGGNEDGAALSVARFNDLYEVAYTWDNTQRKQLNLGNRFFVIDDQKIRMIHLCSDYLNQAGRTHFAMHEIILDEPPFWIPMNGPNIGPFVPSVTISEANWKVYFTAPIGNNVTMGLYVAPWNDVNNLTTLDIIDLPAGATSAFISLSEPYVTTFPAGTIFRFLMDNQSGSTITIRAAIGNDSYYELYYP